MSWDVAASALDHHNTVGALAGALPDTAYGTDSDRDRIAGELAANLAKVGLALVPLTGGPLADDPLADNHLSEQAATSWFGREGD